MSNESKNKLVTLKLSLMTNIFIDKNPSNNSLFTKNLQETFSELAPRLFVSPNLLSHTHRREVHSKLSQISWTIETRTSISLLAYLREKNDILHPAKKLVFSKQKNQTFSQGLWHTYKCIMHLNILYPGICGNIWVQTKRLL